MDEKLLLKIANQLNKEDTLSVRKNVSARASKLHISRQAALVLIAHERGIKTTVYERGLSSEIREEIRAFTHSKSPARGITVQTPKYQNTNRTKIITKSDRPWWEHPYSLAIFTGLFLFLLGTYIAHRLGWLG